MIIDLKMSLTSTQKYVMHNNLSRFSAYCETENRTREIVHTSIYVNRLKQLSDIIQCCVDGLWILVQSNSNGRSHSLLNWKLAAAQCHTVSI